MNVDLMLRMLTAKQFLEHEAAARLDPFEEVKADWNAAHIVSMIFNMAVAVKDRKKLGDFVLKFEEQSNEPPRRTQSLEEQMNLLKVLAAMHATPPSDAEQKVATKMDAELAKARGAMK